MLIMNAKSGNSKRRHADAAWFNLFLRKLIMFPIQFIRRKMKQVIVFSILFAGVGICKQFSVYIF